MNAMVDEGQCLGVPLEEPDVLDDPRRVGGRDPARLAPTRGTRWAAAHQEHLAVDVAAWEAAVA